VPGIRLSDDPAEAARQARALARLASEEQGPTLFQMVGPLLKSARRRARDCGWVFDVTGGDVLVLLDRQNGRCAVSGLPFSGPDAAASTGPYAPVLDVLDPAAGFRTGNLRIICAAADTTVQAWGLDVLQRLARAVTQQAAAARPPSDTASEAIAGVAAPKATS
jgi:hypothetical protein